MRLFVYDIRCTLKRVFGEGSVAKQIAKVSTVNINVSINFAQQHFERMVVRSTSDLLKPINVQAILKTVLCTHCVVGSRRKINTVNKYQFIPDYSSIKNCETKCMTIFFLFNNCLKFS